MADKHRLRTLVESPEYAKLLELMIERYSMGVVNAALNGVLWGIATNPTAYERVTPNIYAAKSSSFNPTTPRFQIFFSLPNDDEALLRWIDDISSGFQMLVN